MYLVINEYLMSKTETKIDILIKKTRRIKERSLKKHFIELRKLIIEYISTLNKLLISRFLNLNLYIYRI
jgi:hypothetical protein